MTIEPVTKRVIGFVDGQNLFYAAKQAFGYSYPNYDPKRLTEVVATAQDWNAVGVRFYTGIPDAIDNPFCHHFWTAKLAVMGTQGVVSYARPLRYRNQTIALPAGGSPSLPRSRETPIP